MANETDIKK